MTTLNIEELITNTVASVAVAKGKYGSFDKEQELEDTFHAAGRGLSLIEGALKEAEPDIVSEDVPQAVTASLESCKSTSAKLLIVFDELSKVQANERRDCYVALVKRKGRSNLVEILVKNMMDYVCRILENYETEDLQTQLRDLKTAIDTLKKLKPSVPIEKQKGGHRFTNRGGTQYNATDNARQFNGTTFNGGTTFN